MRLVAALLALGLTSCGGSTEYDATTTCKKAVVPVTELHRECHAVGDDQCAYTTTDSSTILVDSNECKEVQ